MTHTSRPRGLHTDYTDVQLNCLYLGPGSTHKPLPFYDICFSHSEYISCPHFWESLHLYDTDNMHYFTSLAIYDDAFLGEVIYEAHRVSVCFTYKSEVWVYEKTYQWKVLTVWSWLEGRAIKTKIIFISNNFWAKRGVKILC